MIQITPQMRIWLAVEPVDFRKGIDGLAQVCRQQLKIDPMAGALVVFPSRRRKALKCLVFDGYGNTEIMGRQFRPKGRFPGKNVFPVRDDGPIILMVSAAGFVLGLIFGLSLTARRSMRKHGKLLGGVYPPNGYGQKILSSERASH